MSQKTKRKSKKQNQFMNVAMVALATIILGFFFLIIASISGVAGKLPINLPAKISSFALIMVWAAVLVPVIAKTGRAKTYDEKKNNVTILAVMALLVTLTILFLTNSNLG